MIDLIVEHLRTGNLEKAEEVCREILAAQPDNADALHFLGLISFHRKEYASAIKHITKALQIKPDFPDAENNIGIVHQEAGQLNEAILHYKKALEIKPDFVLALFNLGTSFQAIGHFDKAENSYRKVIELNPKMSGAHYYLGIIFHRRGQFDEAVACYRMALTLDPHLVGAYYMLGELFQAANLIDDAIAAYTKAVTFNPNYAEAHNNLGVAFQGKGQFEKAAEHFRRAIEVNPGFVQAYNNLGNAMKDLGDLDKAFWSYSKATSLRPEYALAHYNMGNVLGYQGRLDKAIESYEKALKSDPGFLSARWARCMSQLPVVYKNSGSIQFARERYKEELIALHKSIVLDTEQDIDRAFEAVGSHQPFLLACQGLNNRDLQRLYGNLVSRIMAKKYPRFVEKPLVAGRIKGEPFRIGIVSAYFHFHSLWKIPIRGWVEHIDQERFQLYGYYTGTTGDHVTEAVRKRCPRFVEGIHSFEELCRIIREDNLHALIFPEIGMDPTTLRLAALRFAPVQCGSLGHPDTSGLPNVDYYLSSDLMEPPDADEHYTEQLIRLPNLGFSYAPFDVSPVQVTRETFGLRPKSVLYFCSHALFTYLPQYDDVFPLIAKQTRDCQFLFISHQHKDSPVSQQFHMRLKQAFSKFKLSHEQYVVFLPSLSPEEYNAVNTLCDVFLDSIGWSSNNSTFEALACHLPVVTFPGALMRQRHCAGILTMMGLTETIASSVEEYIAFAVQLGEDTAWRNHLSRKIAANKHRLYHDKHCIAALEDFLEKAVTERL